MQKKPPDLLRWLEKLGDWESVKDKEAITALELIYANVTGEKVNLKPRYRHGAVDDFWMTRIHVGGFLKHAARIAENVGDTESKMKIPLRQNEILRRAAARMKQNGAASKGKAIGLPLLEHTFVVRAIIPAAGGARMEIVRPKDASPEFCVRYAMWRMALEVPVEKWRRYRLRTCYRKSCGRKFYDTRWIMKHGPLRYCSPQCQKQRAH